MSLVDDILAASREIEASNVRGTPTIVRLGPLEAAILVHAHAPLVAKDIIAIAPEDLPLIATGGETMEAIAAQEVLADPGISYKGLADCIENRFKEALGC
jgi:transketolase C-terminal domain/subunit